MAERPLLVRLRHDGPMDADGALLGGKAAAVARLVMLGQPVPRAAVLTTGAYRAVASTPPVRELVTRLLAAEHGPTAVTDDEIDRTFLTCLLPADVRGALDALAADLSGPVAVRSSATAEDLAGAAFAGQYRTVLDVGPSDLEHAVRLVWASLWHAAPRAYRRLRGIPDGAPAMAVLVMEMIEPVSAGVLFTRDPVGDDANVRIELVAGRGERLVSGAVTPEAHTWPRAGAAVATATTLGAPLGELVTRGLDLETTWGAPLDIEYAVDHDDRLWLVQVRPITAVAAAASRSPDLTRAGIAEMLPGVLPPLLQQTAGRHVDAGFRALLSGLGADLGAVLRDGDALVRYDRSRALLDLAVLRRITATVPGGSVGVLTRGGDAGPRRPDETAGRTSLVQIGRVLRRRRSAVLESEIVVQAIDRLAADDGVRSDDGIEELLARWERVQDLGARATAAEMTVAALAVAAHDGVERTLARHVGPDHARQLAQRLTTRRRRGAGPLDRCVRARGGDPSQPLTEDAWADVLAHSGSRSVFGGPTWEDDPELAWMALTAAPPDTPLGGDDPLESIRPRPGSPRPPLSHTRRRFVRREAADAEELLDRRERTKRALLDLGGIAHRLTSALGAELVARHVLASVDDVVLLGPDELRAACVDGVAPPDLTRRRNLLAADRAGAAVGTVSPVDAETGWPASPGAARGRAVPVDAPRADAIRRGDVLVARTTDAGWAPLFARAAAIVVEDGGPLSHAAIVARELGVPAVVNVPGIFDRVRAAGPDVTLDVDGSTGSVTIVDDRLELAPVIAPPEGEPRLGVFVTGLIGASALLGVVVSVTEAVSSGRGVRRTRRRAERPAAVVADVVRHGTGAANRATVGLAPARWYAQLAGAVLAAGVLGSLVATITYAVGEDPDRIAWSVTAMSTAAGVLPAWLVLHEAAARWPDVPPAVRRFPMLGPARVVTELTEDGSSVVRALWRRLPSPHRSWALGFGAIAGLLLAVNLVAPQVLRRVDEPLYDALGAPDPDPWGPDWFGMYFGRPQVVVPIALLVALFTVRCRVLAITYPLTIAFGGLLNLGLGAWVGKARPPLGAHADQTDAFPSGHAIEVTLLLGLLPLAVAVLLRSRLAERLVRVVASGVLAVMLIDGLREGSHWPTDHLGGFAIAMTAVVAVHALARMPAVHRTCTHCPALALRHDRCAVVETDGGEP